MTKIISFLAGPGGGKSTKAAELYAKMKQLGYSVELVREAAKDYAWEDRIITESDQVYLAAEQMRRESILFGKVDYIITDSPVVLGGFYMERNHDALYLTRMIQDYLLSITMKQDVSYKYFLLDREKTYDPNGRFESEEEITTLDEDLLSHIDYLGINYLKTNDITVILKDLGCGFCEQPCGYSHCVTKRKK